jgi:D-alanyl-D-alanine carboxypeptidase (penicillin-binding protein 5/6)
MFSPLSRPSLSLATLIIASAAAVAAPARQPARSGAPSINPEAYRSAIVIDAATGNVLFESKADVQNPPASVTKLMTFCVIHDKIQRGELALDTLVVIPAEAAKMGGSEAWLIDKEPVSVEELLNLLMVQSANDAAVALAIHTTGSKEAFVELMNAKARELGMAHTEFHSPHGLPPGRGQEPDLSTARDIALLSRELITKTDILRYSSTRKHQFRHANGVVNDFTNHNHLLGSVPGCDGLKTGWYEKAGYSLAATVQRGGRRIIAVILGSPVRTLRDTVTTQLIERGFAALPPVLPPITASAVAPVPAHASSAPGQPPAASPAAAPAATPAPPSAAAPAQTDDASSALRLIPMGPGDQKPPSSGDAPTEPTVHVVLPGAKR